MVFGLQCLSSKEKERKKERKKERNRERERERNKEKESFTFISFCLFTYKNINIKQTQEDFVDPKGEKRALEGPDGFAYCTRDFLLAFPHCPKCGKMIEEEYIDACGERFHVNW